jgi:hypothetical protein
LCYHQLQQLQLIHVVLLDGIFSGGESGVNAEAEGGSTSTGAPCSNSPFHINADETTLTQLFEEGLDRAGEESDDDLI